MLTATKIIRFIEKRLGYKFNELELEHEEILENIREETLITFSKFFPYQTTVVLKESDKVPNRAGSYYIDTDLDIINVANIISNDMTLSDPALAYTTIRRGTMDRFSMQNMADYASMSKNPVTFKFEDPNIITITPTLYNADTTTVQINAVHPPHFGTIPNNMQEEFLKLCLYDTKEVLYNIRHRFANLQTVYGNIELFIDDLSEASDRRNDLLENWRKYSGKQATRKKIYVY